MNLQPLLEQLLPQKVLYSSDPPWSVFRLEGKDLLEYLQRLSTQSFPPPSWPCQAFVLTPNGQALAQFWLTQEEDHWLCYTPKACQDNLIEFLDFYHFGEAIRWELEIPQRSNFYLACHHQTITFPSNWKVTTLSTHHQWCYSFVHPSSPIEQNLTCDTELTTFLRVLFQLPLFGVDYNDKQPVLEVAPPASYQGDKGCFPGQEFMIRVLHQGRTNRSLVQLHSDRLPEDFRWSQHYPENTKKPKLTLFSQAYQQGHHLAFAQLRREWLTPDLLLRDLEGHDVSYQPIALPINNEENPS